MIRRLLTRWHIARARKALVDHEVYSALARQALDLCGEHLERATDLADSELKQGEACRYG